MLIIVLVVLIFGLLVWWWRSAIPLEVSFQPSLGTEQRVFQVTADVGDRPLESAYISLAFPPNVLQIKDQDNLAQGVQIFPISDFDSWQEMRVDQAGGFLNIRLYNQGHRKLKGKINVLTFQAKPLKSFKLRLDCVAARLYTDYAKDETLKARCQGLKVNL